MEWQVKDEEMMYKYSLAPFSGGEFLFLWEDVHLAQLASQYIQMKIVKLQPSLCQSRQGCSRQAVQDGRWSVFTAGGV